MAVKISDDPVGCALLAAAVAMVLLPAGPAAAQQSTVQGQVRDESGAAVFGATVSLVRAGQRL